MSLPFDKYLSGDYIKQNPTWDMEDSQWKAQKVLELMQRNNISYKTLADIGCGAGGVLSYLYDKNPEAQYIGYEISPDARHFWSQYVAKKIAFHVADFTKEKPSSIDILLLLDVIEHLANPYDFLQQLRNRARYYIFHIPLDLSAISVLREAPLLHVRNKVGHIHYFTKNIALSLLSECGFKIVDYSYTDASLTSPQITWKTKVANVARLIANLIFGRDTGIRLLGGNTLIVLCQDS